MRTVATLLVAVSMLGCDSRPNVRPDRHSSPAVESAGRLVPQVEVQMAFDVPSLIGKSIDDVRDALGSRERDEPTRLQIQVGMTEWDNHFESGDHSLLVNFDVKSRRVLDFFLSGDDQSVLLKLGNLDPASSQYRIEAVKALNAPGQITGIKVIPTVASHESEQEQTPELAERRAGSRLRLAQQFLNRGDRKNADKRLKSILEEFPETEAAAEAVKLLKE